MAARRPRLAPPWPDVAAERRPGSTGVAGTAGRVGGGGATAGGADVRADVVAALLRSGAGLDDGGRSTAADFSASIGSTGSPTGFRLA